MKLDGAELGSENNPKALVEAALFLADGGVSREELADVTGLTEESLNSTIEDLRQDLNQLDRGLRIFESKTGLKLQVKQDYLNRVQHLGPHQDISRGVLRTLSVIAYNSPVLQKEVISIRGNGAYRHIDNLMERGFIEAEKEGRTKLLSVTDQFLSYFELNSLEELKSDQNAGSQS